jgi:RHS repeat-associated protein
MKTLLAQMTRSLPLLLLFVSVSDASAFYNPQLQRWLNRDPIDESGSQLLRKQSGIELPSANPYQFAYNNALKDIDPYGLQSVPPIPTPPPTPGGSCTVTEVAKCSATCRRLGASGSCFVRTVYLPTLCGFFPIRVPVCFCWTWRIPPPYTP